MNYQRPLSPHLSIYKPQLTSVLSIMHRMTGVVLYFILLLWCCLLVCLVWRPELFEQIQKFDQTLLGRIGIFSMMVCFYYHFFNGIRHLFWDIGWGYELKTAYRSGYTVLAAATLCTAINFYFL